MARQMFNNFVKLPWDARRRILFLLFDGAGYEDIRTDAVVAAACRERRVTLHHNTFSAIYNSQEYAEYKAALERTGDRVAGDRWAAEALRETSGISDIADVTQLELLEQLRAIAVEKKGDTGELLKLATAIARIKASVESDRVRRKDAQIELLKLEIERLKNERSATVERLERQVGRLQALAGGIDGSQVADALDKQLGL